MTNYDDTGLFRTLTSEEEEQFRDYARHNDPPQMSSWNLYHPICRDEWQKRGIKPSIRKE